MADTAPIKAEPEDGSPAAVATPVDEEDLYEDAGDLEFYDKNSETRSAETMYLARVPKYVWEAWMKLATRLGDDDEVQIGTLRTWNVAKEDGTTDVRDTVCGAMMGVAILTS
jgi:transcription initiation factor TFIIF subunit beta